MTDAIDEAFAADLEKLAVPSELKLNAAKVKAAQDPKKKGAEKPDLGAPGKKQAGFLDRARARTEQEKKDLARLMKGQPWNVSADTIKKRAKRLGIGQKQAALDAGFDADMRQVVGLDVSDARDDFERPDVKVAGQVNDAIDDHYLGWMREKADEDVVKEAGQAEDLARLASRESTHVSSEAIRSALRRSTAKGAAGTAAASALLAGTYLAGKKRGQKTAAVNQDLENEDLLARIRRSAREGMRHGCSDV